MNAGALGSPIRATLRAALSLGALLAATSAFAQAVIHVAPNGDDRAPGSKARPVRSLERAQALVRAASANGDVTVLLADGTYSLDRPLRFGAADGGQRGHRVEWRAAEGARPMLSGGLTVTGFRPYDEARRIWVADVPKGIDARQLWVNDQLAERPWIEIKASDLSFSATGFEIVNPDLAYVAAIQRPDRLEVEATGFFTDRFSPVQSIAGRTVTMQQPAWDNNSWGYDTITKPIFPADSRLFLVNALEFIGKANDWHANAYQWFLDPQAGKLYLRIAQDDDVTRLKVVLPRLDALVSIAGTPAAPVERLSFRGLRFSYTSWLGPSQPTGYANQQSGAFLSEVSPIRPKAAWQSCGWGCVEFESMRQRWNQMPAAVQVAAARDVRFEDNRFTQLGQIALGIGNDANANLSGVGLATAGVRVAGNHFAVLSGSAIMAGGIRAHAHHPGDPALVNRDLVIENNSVATVSQDYKDNAAILTTYISGARIAHNDISDAPYDGIAVGWGWGYNDAGGNPNYDENQKGYVHNTRYTSPTTLRDTVVENNRIHGVKTWFMDGGAIYSLSANPGAVIRGNHIFDIDDKIAIYLDEGSKHFRVTGNVVETRGKWLNINTAGKMFRRRISTGNLATGNWHSSDATGGRWLTEIGNTARDNILVPDRDWPAAARAVIANAGVRR
ncbi:right-handed parallel beta-helix repeat-containing protein [Sphingomonas hengshuiensis]|uniref:right-handed parallel beta-helix repeat-containing protein n=1 Tax=Sphingomonas hengshuiensis TaxID=1609977 RepID=UPI0005C7EAFE|nr:right-handed parallel beta-helix repeat-containing protein [Sphingomonas hengshuiensis]